MTTKTLNLNMLENGLILDNDSGETLGFYRSGSGKLHLSGVPRPITVTGRNQAVTFVAINAALPESDSRLIERPLSRETVFN